MTGGDPDSVAIPPAPEAAERLFGDRLPIASRYADLLAGEGVRHGHIGPREVERLWLRHLVNSALVADLLPEGAAVLDVGSGAGLPGLPIAIRRPDLRLTLLEPMLRRSEFLTSAAAALDLSAQVTVVRGRADDAEIRSSLSGQQWIVARAVAPLDRLVRWCVPLLTPGGRLLALKGESAAAEVESHDRIVRRLSGGPATVVSVGANDAERTWVVAVQQHASQRQRARRAR